MSASHRCLGWNQDIGKRPQQGTDLKAGALYSLPPAALQVSHMEEKRYSISRVEFCSLFPFNRLGNWGSYELPQICSVTLDEVILKPYPRPRFLNPGPGYIFGPKTRLIFSSQIPSLWQKHFSVILFAVTNEKQDCSPFPNIILIFNLFPEAGAEASAISVKY